jgi:two-component system cell cycle sensor histidine kinase PleC
MPQRLPRKPRSGVMPLDDVGHALRTPLNAVLGFSEIMARELFGPLGDARYRDYAGSIHRSAAEVLAMIDGVQRWLRLRRDASRAPRRPVELLRLARRALDRAAPMAAARGVRLGLNAPAALPLVAGDRAALLWLIGELLDNAIGFNRPGGVVHLRLRRGRGGGVSLAVVDTGVGIPPAARARVLAPFTQLKPAGVPPRGGAGLGLAFAAAIADRHGSRLRLATAAGGGTIVRLHLPPAPSVRTPRGVAKPDP